MELCQREQRRLAAVVFRNVEKAGAKYMVVEVERYTGTPFEGVKESYDYLNDAAFVKESYSN